jgi:hypothetical protein
MMKTFAIAIPEFRIVRPGLLFLTMFCAALYQPAPAETGDSLLARRIARHQQRQVVSRAHTTATLPNAAAALITGYSPTIDWPVFVDNAPSRMTQRDPVCLSGNGTGALVVFLDERNGPYGLWGARLNTGGYPANNNVLIYPASGSPGLGIPEAVGFGSGISALAFPDAEQAGIFVLPFDDNLSPIAPAQRITPAATGVLFDRPDIAVTSTGMIVVWEDYRFGSRVYARFADSSGISLQPEFLVHENLTPAQRWVPRVAVGDGDTTLIVWEDYRAGLPGIYYRVFTGEATPVTGDLPAATGGAGVSQYQPDVVYGAEYGFLLCWIDTRSGVPAVYGRLVGLDGSAAAAEFLIANPADTSIFMEPALSATGPGQAVVVYESFAARNIVTGRRVFQGAPFGNAFSISLPSAYGERFGAAITYRADGGMLAAWTDYREGDPDIRARSLTVNALPAGDDLQINDDGVGNQQYVGDGAPSNLTSVYVVYTDLSNDDGDIYVQEISAGGQLFGAPVKVNDDAGPARQAEPAMAVDGAGDVHVVWTDVRNGTYGPQWDIYYQSLPGGLSAAVGNLRVSDDKNFAVQSQPDLAVFPSGGTIAVWTDGRLGETPAVYGQIIDESPALEGTNFRISMAATPPDAAAPKAAAFDDDHAVVGWRSEDEGAGAIQLRWYNRVTGPLDTPFPLLPDPPAYEPQEFDLAALPDEGFIVFWRGWDGDSAAVYSQKYDNSCLPIGGNVRVSVNGSPAAGRVSVDVDDDGYMVFSWTDTFGGKPAVARRVYDPLENPLGPVETVSSDAGNSISSSPVAVATGRYATVLFNDNRGTGKGFDVRAGFSLYTPTGIVGGEESQAVPERFGLLQNYPNPFNPATMIEYRLAVAGDYELTVYDLLGRKVRTLVSGYLPAGRGSAVWDGEDQNGQRVSSGMYFSRLRGRDLVSTCKMTLLK